MSGWLGTSARALAALGLTAALGSSPALAADSAGTPASPPLVEVQASATPEDPTIGSHIRYQVDVVAPPGVEIVVAQPPERIGDLEIVDFGTAEPRALRSSDTAATKDGRVVLERWWTLVAWSTGAHELSSPEVAYRLPGGELQSAPPAKLTITVASLLDEAKDASDIRDIKPPLPIPIDWRPFVAIAIVLAALVAAVLLYRWLAARRRRVAPSAAPLSPHVIALNALDALRARRLVEKGALKEYYSSLTDIVRAYLEGRYRVRAPEMTTEEFLVASSRDGRLGPLHRRLLGDFLTESDLVKFARHLPSTDDSERAYAAARRFVDETKERSEELELAAG